MHHGLESMATRNQRLAVHIACVVKNQKMSCKLIQGQNKLLKLILAVTYFFQSGYSPWWTFLQYSLTFYNFLKTVLPANTRHLWRHLIASWLQCPLVLEEVSIAFESPNTIVKTKVNLILHCHVTVTMLTVDLSQVTVGFSGEAKWLAQIATSRYSS